MASISKKMLGRVSRLGKGHVFTAKNFIDLGSRQAIDTALSRLAAQKKIRRLAQGIYVCPKQHALLGDLLPSLDLIASTLAKETDSRIQITGARALYLLGLTTQVPTQMIYLTDGPTRNIVVNNSRLLLKHATSNVMKGAGTRAGTLIQAIRYLGKDHVDNNILDKISKQLNKKDKRDLKILVRFVPAWIQPHINYLTLV